MLPLSEGLDEAINSRFAILEFMVSKVPLGKTTGGMSEAYRRVLDLIGGINDLNSAFRAVVNSFTHPKRILLAESDNHEGRALDRLQVWKEVFSDRVIPFDLSRDPDVWEATVCGEKICFSRALFKLNVLVSLHVLREGTAGSIFKNLLGLVPDTRKERFHGDLGAALVNMAEAVGWVDLAVIDGTYSYGGEWKEGEPMSRKRRDLLVVGRDPVAVETVGSLLVGVDPLSIGSIAVAKSKGLGEADISRIELLGESIECLK